MMMIAHTSSRNDHFIYLAYFLLTWANNSNFLCQLVTALSLLWWILRRPYDRCFDSRAFHFYAKTRALLSNYIEKTAYSLSNVV